MKKRSEDKKMEAIEGYRWMQNHTQNQRVWCVIYGENAIIRGPQGGLRKVSARALFKTERELMSNKTGLKWRIGYAIVDREDWNHRLRVPRVAEIKHFVQADGVAKKMYEDKDGNEERFYLEHGQKIYKTEAAAWNELGKRAKAAVKRNVDKLKKAEAELQVLAKKARTRFRAKA